MKILSFFSVAALACSVSAYAGNEGPTPSPPHPAPAPVPGPHPGPGPVPPPPPHHGHGGRPPPMRSTLVRCLPSPTSGLYGFELSSFSGPTIPNGGGVLDLAQLGFDKDEGQWVQIADYGGFPLTVTEDKESGRFYYLFRDADGSKRIDVTIEGAKTTVNIVLPEAADRDVPRMDTHGPRTDYRCELL